uniref:Uncharacterized protein n=1 Tax=mine drainage metagenome TaxID=410659 RepID=E6PWY1_9ZZZZ
MRGNAPDGQFPDSHISPKELKGLKHAILPKSGHTRIIRKTWQTTSLRSSAPVRPSPRPRSTAPIVPAFAALSA